MNHLLQFAESGIYCAVADVYIDPWRPVSRALITHAHADHAYSGHGQYIAHEDSVPILKYRLGNTIAVRGEPYGKCFSVNGVQFSFHPAGHVIGSAQIRVAYKGQIWVVSGDYKLQNDGLCTPFEPVPCQHFITEATFALPVFKWPEPNAVAQDINQWWSNNAAEGKVSVLGGYSLGKAQRILQMLNPAIGSIYTHGAVENTNEVLRGQGISLHATRRVTADWDKKKNAGAIVICPPAALGSSWMRKLGKTGTAFCSGWMALRGTRRRRAADRGFIISDHADWEGLNQAVIATGAENVYVTHGYTTIYARYLREESKLNAVAVETF